MFWSILLGLLCFLYFSIQFIKKIPSNPQPHQTFKSYFYALPQDMQQSFLRDLDKNTRALVEYYLQKADESLEAQPKPLFLEVRSNTNRQLERQLDLELEQEMWQIFKKWAISKEN